MSLKIYCGSRIENLAEKLKERLLKERQGKDPFVFTKVVVPNGNLAKWLQIRMFAKEPDLCAGVQFPFMEKELTELMMAGLPPDGREDVELLPDHAYAKAIVSILLAGPEEQEEEQDRDAVRKVVSEINKNAGGTESEYWVDYDYRRLRLMVEISDFNSAQVEREMAQIQADAEALFPGAKITTVGNIPQYVTMMQYLVRGQMLSFVISILIIGVILMIAFQSIRVGLIGLIPNMMPAIFVGGYMGWMGVPLDMMTATLLPMMLGMAVDDTIHFINHSKLEYDRTLHYQSAIRRTFRVVGVAIVITSIITSAVFASFCTSACTMCINFGLMAIIGILSALAADLLVTPILVSKCKVFGKERN